MSTALRGIRVLDLADESASLAGRILADLGAEVVLVEPPEGSRNRHLAPFLDGMPGPDSSCVHLYRNANKLSVVADLDTDEGVERVRDLAATADVFIETARPGHLAERGLDHADLSAANPGLVHASITPFGRDGAWRDWKATDLTATAAGGLTWVSGERNGPPWHGAAAPAHTMAGLITASGVMLALTGRDRHPERPGAHLDISLQEAAAMAVMQTATPSAWSWHGRVPGRPGLSGAVECADGGYVGMLLRPDRFDAFLAWLDETGVEHALTPDDWPWARVTAPRRNNPVAEATLALAASHTRDDFVDRAFDADMVCLPVMDFDDLAGHPQFVENDQFLDVEHEPLGRTLGFVRSPVDAMADGVEIRRAPLLGEHDDRVTPRAALADPTPPELADGTPVDPTRPLAGIRILDFGWVLAAPIGTRILASFGAEVVRIESSHKPDSIRSYPGPDGEPDLELSGLFNDVNTGKLSLTVDTRTEAGQEVIRRLVAVSDVVVNNFRPGALERMGFGYGVLTGIRPDIVLLNLPGAHAKGPWAGRSSMGNILMSSSGFNRLMGFAGQRPRGVGVAYPDFTSPHLLVTTILAALRHRRHTGEGQELDLAQLSGLVSLLGIEWMEYRASGVQPPPSRNRNPNYCPHGIYPAAGDDQWCALAVETDDEWAALRELIGRPDLGLGTLAERRADEDSVDAAVSAWTATVDKWDVAARLQAAGIAAAPVEDLSDTYERDPQLRHHYQIVHQPSAPDVDIPVEREAIRFAGVQHDMVRAPVLGEHNEYVIRELLGYSDEQYVQLIVDGVLE